MGSNVEAEIKVQILKQPKGFKGAKPDIQEIRKDLKSIVQNESFSCRNDSTLYAEEECRWYSITDDMKTLSAMYPGILFTVKSDVPGYGEEPAVEYFYEGKTHQAVITFSPFDESLLE